MSDGQTVSLGNLQRQFPPMIAKLVIFSYEAGYQMTFGEAYRTPEQAALNAKSGIGIAHSLHTDRLAIDINLFRNGVFLTGLEDYRPIGEHWETLGGTWGGRFSKPDADHFSIAYGGRK
jgi:hypothetical protein